MNDMRNYALITRRCIAILGVMGDGKELTVDQIYERASELQIPEFMLPKRVLYEEMAPRLMKLRRFRDYVRYLVDLQALVQRADTYRLRMPRLAGEDIIVDYLSTLALAHLTRILGQESFVATIALIENHRIGFHMRYQSPTMNIFPQEISNLTGRESESVRWSLYVYTDGSTAPLFDIMQTRVLAALPIPAYQLVPASADELGIDELVVITLEDQSEADQRTYQNMADEYVDAIRNIQHIIDRIEGRQPRELSMLATRWNSPVSISLKGIAEALLVILEQIIPKRREHVESMAELQQAEKQAVIEKMRAEAFATQAEAARTLAEKEKLLAEAAVLSQQADRMSLENGQHRMRIQEERYRQALEIVEGRNPDLAYQDRMVYAEKLVDPLERITSSPIMISEVHKPIMEFPFLVGQNSFSEVLDMEQAAGQANAPQSYNIAAIRRLLRDAFTPEELRRFCQDHPTFQPIVANLGPGYSLNDMIDQVIEYCRTHLLFGALLAAIKAYNPRQYAHFVSTMGPSDDPGDLSPGNKA
jgi:hypothetical protein